MVQSDKHEQFMRHLVANQPKIHAAIRSLGLNRHDAEDVLQETATVLWRRFDEFEEGTHFDHWACKVARLQTLSFRQRAGKSGSLLDQQTMEVLVADADRLHGSLVAMHETLDDCLERLSEKDHRLIKERFLAGRTNAEIGRLLEKSESTISRALSRVYGQLLACIQRHSQSSLGGSVR